MHLVVGTYTNCFCNLLFFSSKCILSNSRFLKNNILLILYILDCSTSRWCQHTAQISFPRIIQYYRCIKMMSLGNFINANRFISKRTFRIQKDVSGVWLINGRSTFSRYGFSLLYQCVVHLSFVPSSHKPLPMSLSEVFKDGIRYKSLLT